VFSRHSRKLRKVDVFNVDELVATLKESYTMPLAPFPEPKVTLLQEAADTASWLTPHVNKFEGFMKTHQFQFFLTQENGEEYAAMRTKKFAFWPDDRWTEPARVLKVLRQRPALPCDQSARLCCSSHRTGELTSTPACGRSLRSKACL